MTDLAGNTLRRAFNLGTFSNRTRSVRDEVGASDRADFYKIRLTRSSHTVLSLTGLRRDVDLATYDSRGRLLARFENPGRRAELSYGTTAPGIYYIKVFPGTNQTSTYKLTLHSVVIPAAQLTRTARSQQTWNAWSSSPKDQANEAIAGSKKIFDLNSDLNSLSRTRSLRNDNRITSATNLGIFGDRTRQTFNAIGGADSDDFYRIKIAADSHVVLSLVGLRQAAGFATYDSNFRLIRVFDNPGRQSELAYGNTASGTYYIRVFSNSDSATRYRLTVHSARLP
jgi:hypothetical protein